MRVRTALIDQHATWIAVNPIQGCPMACAYCFLNDRGQTGVKPEVLAGPDDTVRELLDSDVYAPERAVALYTWTDVMVSAAARDHLAALLEVMIECSVPNPIVLITKCRVPPATAEQIAAARAAGLEVIVYLSYSGLDRSVEHGVHHEHIFANFPALSAAGIPIVHYWRPALPVNATEPVMTTVLDVAARHARCTVAAGLKVERQAVHRLARHWPELADTPGVDLAEGVYPKAFWDFIHTTKDRFPGYPVFHTNSCALAYVLAQPDRFGIYGSQVCQVRNHCPIAQRRRCAAARPPALTRNMVRDALAARGVTDVAFDLDPGSRTLVVDARLPNRIVSALTQDLQARIQVAKMRADPYWSSGTAGARPLIVEAS